jgi:acyl carrier protein
MKDPFLDLFCSQLEETDITQIDYNTDFKILDEWNSLLALSIIAMVDEEYSVRISGEDLKEARTIDNLFQLVKSRIK